MTSTASRLIYGNVRRELARSRVRKRRRAQEEETEEKAEGGDGVLAGVQSLKFKVDLVESRVSSVESMSGTFHALPCDALGNRGQCVRGGNK